MAPLVRSYSYGMRIFLYGAGYDVLHRTVMPKVNDLHSRGLKDPAHDVNGYIVSIEQGGCRYDANFFGRIKMLFQAESGFYPMCNLIIIQ